MPGSGAYKKPSTRPVTHPVPTLVGDQDRALPVVESGVAYLLASLINDDVRALLQRHVGLLRLSRIDGAASHFQCIGVLGAR